jgi:hypothetical protein
MQGLLEWGCHIARAELSPILGTFSEVGGIGTTAVLGSSMEWGSHSFQFLRISILVPFFFIRGLNHHPGINYTKIDSLKFKEVFTDIMLSWFFSQTASLRSQIHLSGKSWLRAQVSLNFVSKTCFSGPWKAHSRLSRLRKNTQNMAGKD